MATANVPSAPTMNRMLVVAIVTLPQSSIPAIVPTAFAISFREMPKLTSAAPNETRVLPLILFPSTTIALMDA